MKNELEIENSHSTFSKYPIKSTIKLI